ncbi:arsenic metallochaperone ArsD family protein [Tetragenococcus halophilus]|nr:arsenic metallochaperone ArsD family protein [Tetragenococcus halophilus]
MKKLFLYEPAMCCSTGVCGPSVNEDLIRVSSIMNELKKQKVFKLSVITYQLTLILLFEIVRLRKFCRKKE